MNSIRISSAFSSAVGQFSWLPPSSSTPVKFFSQMIRRVSPYPPGSYPTLRRLSRISFLTPVAIQFSPPTLRSSSGSTVISSGVLLGPSRLVRPLWPAAFPFSFNLPLFHTPLPNFQSRDSQCYPENAAIERTVKGSFEPAFRRSLLPLLYIHL